MLQRCTPKWVGRFPVRGQRVWLASAASYSYEFSVDGDMILATGGFEDRSAPICSQNKL